MRKHVLKVFLIAVSTVVISFGFSSIKKAENIHLVYSATLPLDYDVAPAHESRDAVNPPFLGRSFYGFKEALAHSESRGNYTAVNTLGYMGKYQFGQAAMKAVGVDSKEEFLNDPELQERAFTAILQRNKYILRDYIERYSGQVIGGVRVTESGILAAAHLAGAANVKRFLRSYGQRSFKDAYGTTVRFYMKKFAGYDTSVIAPFRKARV